MVGTTTDRPLWRRSEARTVRPFRTLGDHLDGVGLRLTPDADFATADVVALENELLSRIAPEIRLPPPPSDIEDSVGIPPRDIHLLVSVEDRVFKNTVVAARIPLEDIPGVVEFDRDALAGVSWAGETRIHVALVLAGDRDGEVGTAQRDGSWIARKTFKLARLRDLRTFRIDSVPPEYFTNQGLPESTTYLVEILDDDLNQSCELLPDLVKVSVHAQAHAALARDEDSPVGQALLRHIFVDVVTAVLTTGFRTLAGELDERSILAVVSKRLAQSTQSTLEDVRALAKARDDAKLRALVQSHVQLTRALTTAVQRRSL